MENKLISVVLPTYNVVRCLEKCLDSLIDQTYSNIEILVVIDGATDGSYELAQEYETKDSRIKVIYQENAGSGPARNNGIKHSRGEFIAFVDPDDWVNKDYIETLVELQKQKDYDLVIVGHQKCLEIDGKITRTKTKTFAKSTSYIGLSEVRSRYIDLRFKEKLDDTPWGKLFKKEIIDINHLRFPDLRRSQDIYFNALYYDCISSLYESTYSGYYYRETIGDRQVKKTDYYLTAEILFKQFSELMASWKMTYNETEIASIYMLNLTSNYERIIERNESSNDFLKNSFVNYVLTVSQPKSLYHKLTKVLIKYDLRYVAKWVFSIKNIVKKKL